MEEQLHVKVRKIYNQKSIAILSTTNISARAAECLVCLRPCCLVRRGIFLRCRLNLTMEIKILGENLSGGSANYRLAKKRELVSVESYVPRPNLIQGRLLRQTTRRIDLHRVANN